MVECVDPKIWQTVYDGAAGSCGFLIEAFNHLKLQAKKTEQLRWLHNDALFGNEKTPVAYIMGVMNMILHGIENPNLSKKNTLTEDIRNFEEKERFDIILANPPFGGKEKEQFQINFPIKTNATEMLFLQHFMKKLKVWGKAAIIVPEGVLFNTSNAFTEIKKRLVEDFNLHTIVSLPAGVFLPYSWVKTNVILFDRTTSTKEIWYYEVDTGKKLTKNKPINYDDMKWLVDGFKKRATTEQSWIVKVEDIKGYDLSAKNPAKIKEVIHRSPIEILKDIKATDEKIAKEREELERILG